MEHSRLNRQGFRRILGLLSSGWHCQWKAEKQGTRDVCQNSCMSSGIIKGNQSWEKNRLNQFSSTKCKYWKCYTKTPQAKYKRWKKWEGADNSRNGNSVYMNSSDRVRNTLEDIKLLKGENNKEMKCIKSNNNLEQSENHLTDLIT